MQRARRAAGWAVTVVAVAASVGCQPRQPWSSEPASVNEAGTATGDRPSYGPPIFAGPDRVVFTSAASDLVPSDLNAGPDAFVRDVDTGATELVSVNPAGTDSAEGWSAAEAVSADGNLVAFANTGTELAPNNTSGNGQLFVRDLAAGTTTLVSENASGTGAGNGQAHSATFSPDGTKVAFVSRATDLVDAPDPAPWAADVYVRDLATRTTTLVSVAPDGRAGDAESGLPVFSSDGSKLAFVTDAGNLSPLDGEGCDGEGSGWPSSCGDVYVRDLAAGTTSLVSVDATGQASADGIATDPSFDGGGTAIAFATAAANLGPTDSPRLDDYGAPYGPGQQTDVYVRDLTAGTTALVSTNAAGDDSGDRPASRPRFGPGPSDVLYQSEATDTGAPGSHGPNGDVYIRDLDTGELTIVSPSTLPDQASGGSRQASWSPDGTKVLFSSNARDLGPTPQGDPPFLYVRDLLGGVTFQASAGAEGAGGRGPATDGVFGPDGRRVAFLSGAPDPEVTDANGGDDVYVSTFAGTDLQLGLTLPSAVVANWRGEWRVDLRNAGPDVATGATFALLFPPGPEPIPDVPGDCAVTEVAAGQVVTCEVGDVAPNDFVTGWVVLPITAPPGATIPVVVTARSEAFELRGADNTASGVSIVVNAP